MKSRSIDQRSLRLQRPRLFLSVEDHPSFFELLRKDLHSLQVRTASDLILDFHDLFKQCCRAVCDWECELFTFFRRYYFLCIEPSERGFLSQVPRLLDVRRQDISFPDSSPR